MIKEFKKSLLSRYKNCYAEKANKNSNLITVDEFINQVTDYGLFDGWNDKLPSIEYLIKNIFMFKIKTWSNVFFYCF